MSSFSWCLSDNQLDSQVSQRWADGIPIEADRTVATGVSFNETGTPWEGHDHKFSALGRRGKKEATKEIK